MEKNLISIVVPVYNAEKFLTDTINTVLSQTYENWELIFIDDKSTDRSKEIIREFSDKNKKIKLIENKENSGAAVSRNIGIKEAKGEYIAFLDADDLWKQEKLEKQLKFMKERNCAFSFTGYEFANEDGVGNDRKVKIPEKINYRQALKNTTIWTSTVLINIESLGKELVKMPNVRRGQDTATWWKILKTGIDAYGINEVLAYYRRTNESLSANKLKALKRTWNLYRKVEKLNVFYSFHNFCWYCFNAIRRRI